MCFQSSEGLNECEQILSTQGAVGALCMDRNNGAIIAGVQDQIRSVKGTGSSRTVCMDRNNGAIIAGVQDQIRLVS